MKIYTEIENIRDFGAWQGGKYTLDKILDLDRENDLTMLVEEIFGNDPIDEMKLNDFLWFEQEFIFDQLGIEED